ncbi:MAG: hypothetical protein HRU15_19290 [Planctomycetes bacterium]|nr:hypothetical protein [Planctomycetota bacterium]
MSPTVTATEERFDVKPNQDITHAGDKSMDMSEVYDLKARVPRPRIGLLPTGHNMYWDQFPALKEMGMKMYNRYAEKFEEIGDIIAPELVDTPEKAVAAGKLFKEQEVDIVLILPFGYTTGMAVVPAVKDLDVPLRILNTHEDRSYDYKTSETDFYLHHEGPCCIPEYAVGLHAIGKKFIVRSGALDDARFWDEVNADCKGSAAARAFSEMNVGVIGNTYTNMVDMPTDEHRILNVFGKMINRPEIEELVEVYKTVSEEEIEGMLGEIRSIYQVHDNVLDDHLVESAKIAVVYDKIVKKYDIDCFGYYWWGQGELTTQLRSQSALAVSRLAAMGHSGVTEGDLKCAMAMKVFDYLGAGGMFNEFFSFDYKDDIMLIGHDGPSNVAMADGRGEIKHLEVHHGKTGHGIGIDYKMKAGPVTLLNLTQFYPGDRFKLIYSEAEVVDGDVLSIGNPNVRIKLNKPLHTFMNDWCQQIPSHHLALGFGWHKDALHAFAEYMDFDIVEV